MTSINDPLLGTRREVNEGTVAGNSQRHIVREANPDKDKFLFFFVPRNLNVDCCCNCSLKTAIIIISIFYVISSTTNLFEAIKTPSIINLVVAGINLVLYFAAGFCLIYSTINQSFKHAYIGYFIYTIFFFYYLITNIIVLLFILTGYYRPMPEISAIANAFIFLIIITLFMVIYLYLVWIIFSYTIHLKHKRLKLISGDLNYRYLDEDIEVAR